MTVPLRLALSFLTRLPMPHREYAEDDFRATYAYFPVVGLLIGLTLLLTAHLLSALAVSHAVTAFFLVVLPVVITGGLHLDGLADTADGFFGATEREKTLAIMKDSATGAFGSTAIMLALIGKFAALWTLLQTAAFGHIVTAYVLSRWAMCAVAYRAEYPRATGTAKNFIGALTKDVFAAASALTVILSLAFSHAPAIAACVVAGVTAYVVRRRSESAIGGVTGDVIGATNELTEVAVLILLGAIA